MEVLWTFHSELDRVAGADPNKERRLRSVTGPVENLNEYHSIQYYGSRRVLAIYNWYEAKRRDRQNFLVFTTYFPQSLIRYRTKGLSLFEWLLLQRQGLDPCQHYTH